jgi:glucosylceramidase
MPQNEFTSAQVVPSRTWTPQGLARFVRHLGPEMARRGVEVFLGTLERPKEAQAEIVLDDAEAARFIAGVGVQWAGKGAVPYLHRKRPDLRIYQSEQECGDGLNDWRYARYTWSLMRHYMTHGASAYMYWNMALVEGGISRWGWAQNSLIVVDPQTRAYRLSHEYQVLKHMTHFLQPGARVLPTLSYTGFEQQLVWRNPDGSVIVLVHNDTCASQEWSALIGDQVLSAALPADSFSTFVLPAA